MKESGKHHKNSGRHMFHQDVAKITFTLVCTDASQKKLLCAIESVSCVVLLEMWREHEAEQQLSKE